MSATATLDPHYLPALVAAGRAYVAVSGQDPLTGTTINPDYLGLEPELAANVARLGRSAERRRRALRRRQAPHPGADRREAARPSPRAQDPAHARPAALAGRER